MLDKNNTIVNSWREKIDFSSTVKKIDLDALHVYEKYIQVRLHGLPSVEKNKRVLGSEYRYLLNSYLFGILFNHGTDKVEMNRGTSIHYTYREATEWLLCQYASRYLPISLLDRLKKGLCIGDLGTILSAVIHKDLSFSEILLCLTMVFVADSSLPKEDPSNAIIERSIRLFEKALYSKTRSTKKWMAYWEDPLNIKKGLLDFLKMPHPNWKDEVTKNFVDNHINQIKLLIFSAWIINTPYIQFVETNP